MLDVFCRRRSLTPLRMTAILVEVSSSRTFFQSMVSSPNTSLLKVTEDGVDRTKCPASFSPLVKVIVSGPACAQTSIALQADRMRTQSTVFRLRIGFGRRLFRDYRTPPSAV